MWNSEKFRNCQARNRRQLLLTLLHYGKSTISETSISIFDEQLRMSESTKRRSVPPTAGQQRTTEHLSQTSGEF